MSNVFLTFANQCGIKHLHMVRNHPQQNGVAKWVNHMIQEHATAMLYKAGLPPSFLGEVTIQNKCPTTVILSIEKPLLNSGTDANQMSQTSGFGVA